MDISISVEYLSATNNVGVSLICTTHWPFIGQLTLHLQAVLNKIGAPSNLFFSLNTPDTIHVQLPFLSDGSRIPSLSKKKRWIKKKREGDMPAPPYEDWEG